METRSIAAVLLAVLLVVIALAPQTAAADDVLVGGTVVDEEGGAMRGVRISALNVTSLDESSATTNDTGEYVLDLEPGTYNISAIMDGYEANVTYEMVNVTDGTPDLDFTMIEVPGTVTGFVTYGEITLPGAIVYLTNEDNDYSAVSTSPLGEYVIEDVEPGIYIARAERSGFWDTIHPSPVTVTRGDEIRLDFTMDAQPARVLGVVTDESGAELDGVRVVLESGDLSYSTYTDADGNYTLSDIAPGSYTMTLTKDGYLDETREAVAQPFEDEVIDVVMESESSEDPGGFIGDFDMQHSLMISGLVLALVIMVLALIIRGRVADRPERLLIPEEEEESETEE